MDKLKILVACHKPWKVYQDDIYTPIHVGRAVSKYEKAGYSKATKARLDSQKLQELGWKASFSIQKGVDRTIKVLTEIK